MSQSAESAIGFGERLQRLQVTGLRILGVVFDPHRPYQFQANLARSYGEKYIGKKRSLPPVRNVARGWATRPMFKGNRLFRRRGFLLRQFGAKILLFLCYVVLVAVGIDKRVHASLFQAGVLLFQAEVIAVRAEKNVTRQ
jgi:hypothetical protein